MSIYTTHKDVTRIFYLDPIDELTKLDVIIDQEGFDDVVFAYSYSYDDVTYTEWFSTSELMIQHIKLQQTPHTNLYTRVRMAVVKNTLSQDYAYCKVYQILINGTSANVTGIEQSHDTSSIIQYNGSKNLYQAYRGMEDAHILNEKLAYGVSKMFGFKCTYFKTEPDDEDKSVVFKSYRLSSVSDAKELQVSIVNNSIPDNRFNYSEWDADYFDQIEIHIVIEIFNEVFPDQLPNADDYLYLPLTDRMYQVNTVNEVKGFMNKSTYYQAVLSKWEDRADVDDTNVLDELGQFADNVDTFGEQTVKDEIDTATKSYNESDINDINNDIIEDSLTYEALNVMQYMYDLSDTANDEIAINFNVVASDQFAAMLWFKSPDVRNQNIIRFVDSLGMTQFTVHTDSAGKLVLDYTNKITARTLIATGEPLIADTKYGLLLNYGSTPETGKILTISANNGDMLIIQENVTTDFDEIIETSQLQIFGGNSVSNIRVSKNIVLRDDIARVLGDKYPDANGYYMIDNVTPNIISDKYRVR